MSSPPPAGNEPTQRVPFPAFPFVNTPGQTDIILRTSDGVDFYVQLAILSLVSPVFETMFTLPQAEDSSQIYPVIDVQETSLVLDRILRFFYPCTQLTVDSLDELKEVIEILITQYDMQWLIPSVKHLERYVASDPITVYVFAYMHGWEDLGRAAAKETLKLSLRASDDDTPEMLRLIPADAYHKLLRYHYRCSVAARQTTTDLSWISLPQSSTAAYRWFDCRQSSCTAYNSPRGPIVVASKARLVRHWFMEYFVGMGDILASTPAADVRDPAHPLFIRMIDKANECDYCRDRVSNHLGHFTGLWAARIQTVIQEIEWKF
ncbi:BTB domain-containing protein [Mycena sanguinolenta]|uniref:BTB domain-containing protein n=1 Tax=Mycena sanguinolenta TaxID=230812 RepID=A0A8H6ZJC1_9AGAR|nr:BTB domain-containing protein [Mycena sanguinolenta]